MPSAIQARDLSMRFVRHEHRRGLAALRHALSGKGQESLWALDGVSFDVAQGEVLGIMGNNGAGKSTLLSIIAGTLRPTRGHVHVTGRVAPLMSVGAGFVPQLSGRENIHLQASLFGMPGRVIDDRLETIVDFAELHDFIDMPVAHYSTGMASRLGFSIAAHLDADILLLDELLAVGDASFRAKCLEKVQSWVEGDHTVIMVQHGREVLSHFCDRALLIHEGIVRDHGPTDEVLARHPEPGMDAALSVEATDAVPNALP